jgi:hypothetical protein
MKIEATPGMKTNVRATTPTYNRNRHNSGAYVGLAILITSGLIAVSGVVQVIRWAASNIY